MSINRDSKESKKKIAREKEAFNERKQEYLNKIREYQRECENW